MTAKDYLRQIGRMSERIRQRQRELDDLRRNRIYMRATDYSGVKVQSSPAQDGSTRQSDRLIDLERDTERLITEFANARHKIIGQIQQMSDIDCAILYRRYVEEMDFTEISEDINISYYWVSHLHGDALKRFEEKFLQSPQESASIATIPAV